MAVPLRRPRLHLVAVNGTLVATRRTSVLECLVRPAVTAPPRRPLAAEAWVALACFLGLAVMLGAVLIARVAVEVTR